MATQTQQSKQHRFSRAAQKVGRDTRPVQAFLTKFNNDWSLNLAAALAYNLLLSIFPILIAILSIFGLVLGSLNPGAAHDLVRNITSVLPTQVSPSVIDNITTQLPNASSLLGIIAIILAIFNGSRLFILIEGCFGIIYHIRQRAFLRQNLMAIGMLLLFLILIPIMVIASAGPSFVISILQQTPLNQIPGSGFIFSLGGIVGGLIASWLFFQAIYMIVPNQKISFRHSWLGSLVAAVLLELYLSLFSLYTTRFLVGFTGPVGFAVILLIFFYYFAVILLLGAEINAFFGEGIRTTPGDLVTLVHMTTSHLLKAQEERDQQAAASHKDSPPSDMDQQEQKLAPAITNITDSTPPTQEQPPA